MKKFIMIILLVVLYSMNFSICNGATDIVEDSKINIVIDGVLAIYSNTPIILKGRTLIPLRELLINMGVSNDDDHILWNGNEGSVTINKDTIEILLKVENNIGIVNGKPVLLDTVPVNYKGRIYIPVRFIAENFGKKVLWDSTTRTIAIYNELTYNDAKSIIFQANDNLSYGKFKSHRIFKGNEYEIVADVQCDNTKDIIHSLLTQKMGDSKYPPIDEIYVISNSTFRRRDSSEWIKNDTKSLLLYEQNSILDNNKISYVFFGGLTINDTGKDIILEGDIGLDYSHYTTYPEFKPHVKIIVEKSSMKFSEINVEVSNEKEITKYINVKYEYSDLNFEIDIPKEIQEQDVNIPSETILMSVEQLSKKFEELDFITNHQSVDENSTSKQVSYSFGSGVSKCTLFINPPNNWNPQEINYKGVKMIDLYISKENFSRVTSLPGDFNIENDMAYYMQYEVFGMENTTRMDIKKVDGTKGYLILGKKDNNFYIIYNMYQSGYKIKIYTQGDRVFVTQNINGIFEMFKTAKIL